MTHGSGEDISFAAFCFIHPVYTIDNYPGHGLECYQYRKMVKELPKPEAGILMTAEEPLEIMSDSLVFSNIRLNIGDTKADIHHKLRYGKWKEEKEEYYIGCMFCWEGFYNLDFVYDEKEQLKKISIVYWEDF